MRLAMAFGEPDVDRFLGRITIGQFVEWMDFLGLEMGGKERQMLGAQNTQQLASAIMTRLGAPRGFG